MIEQMYSVSEVAARLSVSRGWVLRAIERWGIAVFRLRSPETDRFSRRSMIRVPESSVDAIAERAGIDVQRPCRRVSSKAAERRLDALLLELGLPLHTESDGHALVRRSGRF
jgi:hypothetical protein